MPNFKFFNVCLIKSTCFLKLSITCQTFLFILIFKPIFINNIFLNFCVHSIHLLKYLHTWRTFVKIRRTWPTFVKILVYMACICKNSGVQFRRTHATFLSLAWSAAQQFYTFVQHTMYFFSVKPTEKIIHP